MTRIASNTIAILCSAVLLAGAGAWAGGLVDRPAAAAAPPGGAGAGAGVDAPPHANPVFARNVAGTWLNGAGTHSQHLMNIEADGTMLWFGTWFYGAGRGQSFDGPVFCSWKQTGAFEMTTTELGFLFDGDGLFRATGRVTQVFTFSPDFQSFTAEGKEDLFYPEDDPTDPAAEPFLSFTFSYGPAKRLNFPQ